MYGGKTWRGALLDAGRLPVLGAAVTTAYDRYFHAAKGRDTRLFHGVYPDFASAHAAIPARKNSGYDNAASAGRNAAERQTIYASDYPVMFWLAKLLPECGVLFDWGGNVGLKYFAYRDYLAYPEALTWLVNDVPAVVDLGRQTARREAARGLEFTTTLERVAESHVLLAGGSLHFIDDPLGRLRGLERLPAHFILNKVPAHAGPSVWTLNNMGTAMCPYHLFDRRELVGQIEALGYRLVDQWQSADNACKIPFHPEYDIQAYSGFYFAKT